MSPREFIDKRIFFKWLDDNNEEGRVSIYAYYSCLPIEKEEEIKGIHKTEIQYVTGKTILSVQKITYNHKTKKDIKYSMYNQIDPDLGMATGMAAKMMPKMTQQWFKTLSKHLEETYLKKEETEQPKNIGLPKIVINQEGSEDDKI